MPAILKPAMENAYTQNWISDEVVAACHYDKLRRKYRWTEKPLAAKH
jgi:hypothetical protein